MDQFARTVIGYHGCTEDFASRLLLGGVSINDWTPSTNAWDWLGHGIYFWEHAPSRAARWARELCGPNQKPAVIGAVIQLGNCFDLLDEAVTREFADGFRHVLRTCADQGVKIPVNRGIDWKRRERDCFVINACLTLHEARGVRYDTVRGAFTEGEPVYPGAGFSTEAHIQIAVRDRRSILGIFRPHLDEED